MVSSIGLTLSVKARNAILQLIRDSKVQAIRVAELSGITPNTISRWRKESDSNIRPSTVEAVADALNHDTIWLDLNRTECKFEARGEQQTGGQEMEKSEEYRYEAHVKDGVRERFDRKTGRWEIYDESRGEWRKLGKEG